MIRILLWCMMLLSALAGAAQTPRIQPQANAAGDTAVYFISVGPGREIYELEGHSAIGVVLPGGLRLAYNYGVFDFNSPNFVTRFVKGETDYMTVAAPMDYFLASYAGTGRRIEAARLDMDPQAVRRLLDILNHDTDPRFRTYRYNYVLNNCATRPLRAVEIAVGDSLMLPPPPHEAQSSAPTTFRNIMRHYHRNYPWYQFGIDLALGSGIDRVIDRREATFAPEELRRMLPAAHYGDRRLVSSTVVLQEEPAEGASDGPTPWYATPLAICWAVFALAAAVSIRDLRKRRTNRLFDTFFYGILGLAGLLLSFLIFVSVHEATSSNWQFVWINPLCLTAALAVWIKKAKKVLMCYHFINFVAVVTFVLAWQWIPQSGNAAFVPLVAVDILRSGCYLYIHRKRED